MTLKGEPKPVGSVDGAKLHKMKQTTLGLYVTAAAGRTKCGRPRRTR